MHPCAMPLITSCRNCKLRSPRARFLIALPPVGKHRTCPRGGALMRGMDGVRSEKIGDVTVVTLDRPEVRNAVDGDTACRLYEPFLAFDSDASARLAVFHGANGHFC